MSAWREGGRKKGTDGENEGGKERKGREGERRDKEENGMRDR